MIAGANVHDTKLLAQTLNALVVEHPLPTPYAPQYFCLDKGYDNPTGHAAVTEHNYVPHIRRIGTEKVAPDGEKPYPARRWVVERTHAWNERARRLIAHHDRSAWAPVAWVWLTEARMLATRLAG